MRNIVASTGLLALGLTLLLGACSKSNDEKDIERPVISLLSPGDDSLRGGNALQIRAIITDNELLSQVKIEIHDDFDAHSHGKKAGAPAFVWDTIMTLSGIETTLDFPVAVPEDIASGRYHFQMQALDASGNEAEFVVRSLFLTNAFDTIAPIISNLSTTPAAQNGTITVKSGATLSIRAALSDNLGLEKLELKIIRSSNQEIVYDFDKELSGTATNLNELLTIDSQWGTGDFVLELLVIDEKGNRADMDLDLVVE